MNNPETSNLKTPKTIVLPDADSASRHVAELISDAIGKNPSMVLGLATGGTPTQTYAELVRAHQEKGLDFSRVTTFNLDEYIGLGAQHERSFRAFMQHHLFDHVNISPANIHIPDGRSADPNAHAIEYEDQIKAAGGIDLQILGIGRNGHIAFNEPGSSSASRTRVVALTQDTIEANARFFESIDEVPTTAISMGIGTILEAKRILLLAFGEEKAEAVSRALNGPITEDHPASLLRLHDNVTFVVDDAAAIKTTVG